jgi:hypothetical protein
VHDWRETKAKGDVVGTILFVLSSAFDLVDAKLLESKLKIYGADERTCLWICSYITDTWQEVQIGDAGTKLAAIPRGVPQEGGLCVLSVCIFKCIMTAYSYRVTDQLGDAQY